MNREQRRALIEAQCMRRGITLKPLACGAYRLTGPGIDVVVADLRHVQAQDLRAVNRNDEDLPTAGGWA